MKNAKLFLMEINRRFPILDNGAHALLYEPARDLFVVQINLHGAFFPFALSEQELEEESSVLIENILKILKEREILT
jgi:hypothetical protein